MAFPAIPWLSGRAQHLILQNVLTVTQQRLDVSIGRLVLFYHLVCSETLILDFYSTLFLFVFVAFIIFLLCTFSGCSKGPSSEGLLHLSGSPPVYSLKRLYCLLQTQLADKLSAYINGTLWTRSSLRNVVRNYGSAADRIYKDPHV